MTGLIIQIRRGGRLPQLDIAQLTDDELRTYAETQSPERGWAMAIFLAAWIRDHSQTAPEAAAARGDTEDPQ